MLPPWFRSHQSAMLCYAYDVKAEIHEYTGELESLEEGMLMEVVGIQPMIDGREYILRRSMLAFRARTVFVHACSRKEGD